MLRMKHSYRILHGKPDCVFLVSYMIHQDMNQYTICLVSTASQRAGSRNARCDAMRSVCIRGAVLRLGIMINQDQH